MKKNIHPERQEVLFKDVVTGEVFLVRSTAASAETMMWTDGREYPVVKVEISSSSHPAYTGKQSELPPTSRAVEFQKKFSRESLH